MRSWPRSWKPHFRLRGSWYKYINFNMPTLSLSADTLIIRFSAEYGQCMFPYWFLSWDIWDSRASSSLFWCRLSSIKLDRAALLSELAYSWSAHPKRCRVCVIALNRQPTLAWRDFSFWREPISTSSSRAALCASRSKVQRSQNRSNVICHSLLLHSDCWSSVVVVYPFVESGRLEMSAISITHARSRQRFFVLETGAARISHRAKILRPSAEPNHLYISTEEIPINPKLPPPRITNSQELQVLPNESNNYVPASFGNI